MSTWFTFPILPLARYRLHFRAAVDLRLPVYTGSGLARRIRPRSEALGLYYG